MWITCYLVFFSLHIKSCLTNLKKTENRGTSDEQLEISTF